MTDTPTRAEVEELLPCPFCGETDGVYSEQTHPSCGIARCSNCNATHACNTEAEAIQRWNRRATLPPQAAPCLHDWRGDYDSNGFVCRKCGHRSATARAEPVAEGDACPCCEAVHQDDLRKQAEAALAEAKRELAKRAAPCVIDGCQYGAMANWQLRTEQAAPKWTPTHQHYKGGFYRKIGDGIHTETNEPLTFYEDQSRRLFARPKAMFDEAGRFTPIIAQAAPEGKPTSAEINALPQRIRDYIAALETECDPAGTIRENFRLREENAGLRALDKERAEAHKAALEAEARVAEMREACIREFLIRHAVNQDQADFANAILRSIRALPSPSPDRFMRLLEAARLWNVPGSSLQEFTRKLNEALSAFPQQP